MRPIDFGPVPVSRLKPEATPMFDALDQGRRVLISKHGRVVAAIDPPRSIPRDLLAGYAIGGGHTLRELTATEINQGSPSAAVTASLNGLPSFVTRDNRVYGVLREISEDELTASLPTSEQVAERERRIQEFMRDTPDADIEQVATFAEAISLELGSGSADLATEPRDLYSGLPTDRMREIIQAVARDYARDTGDLVQSAGLAGTADVDALVVDLEARTIEALARATVASLSTAVSVSSRAAAVNERVLEMAQTRASEVLTRFPAIEEDEIDALFRHRASDADELAYARRDFKPA